MNAIFGVLLLGLLILINGLFVAAEYALVSIRKSRVEEMARDKSRNAQTIRVLKTQIDRSIAGSQLGITALSLAAGWFGGGVVAQVLNFFLGFAPKLILPQTAIFAASFVMLSLTQVIFGEQIPKQIALRLPEATIVRLAAPFRLFCLLMTPFIWLMSLCAAAAVRMLGINEVEAQEQPLPSPDEFRILFEESEKAGTLGAQESSLLQRALELKALTVRQVMVPKAHMDCIPDTHGLPDVLAVASRTKHSKLPVFHISRDNVIGVFHTRDLFDHFASVAKTPGTLPPFKLTALVRKPHFVPESMLASSLLEQMKRERIQMVIVVDEFGSTTGVVTLEDLLEQLVGEIWDEYDNPITGIEQLGENRWKVLGELTLYEFNKAFSAEVSCQNHCTTIAGAVIEALDHQPSAGETIELGGFSFQVTEMRGLAIGWLELSRVAPNSVSTPLPDSSESNNGPTR